MRNTHCLRRDVSCELSQPLHDGVPTGAIVSLTNWCHCLPYQLVPLSPLPTGAIVSLTNWCHCLPYQLVPLSPSPTGAIVSLTNWCHCLPYQLVPLSPSPTGAIVSLTNWCHCLPYQLVPLSPLPTGAIVSLTNWCHCLPHQLVPLSPSPTGAIVSLTNWCHCLPHQLVPLSPSPTGAIVSLTEPDQNKERMMAILEDRSLSFLFPLLHLQTELWQRIQTEPSATDLYKWVHDTVDLKLQKTPGFIVILLTRCGHVGSCFCFCSSISLSLDTKAMVYSKRTLFYYSTCIEHRELELSEFINLPHNIAVNFF